jgi:1,2-dihydroxy-3-keto-5-methylthiopentene dioxygenase
MSALTIYREDGTPTGDSFREHQAIAEALKPLSVRFERWAANRPLSSDADQEGVLAAYAEAIEQLKGEFAFQSIDVAAVHPSHPQKDEMRGKFLSEHTHSDFEVRFFVDGRGAFYLHVGDKVYLILCEKGDLICVPAGTTHWFDMGAAPDFKCIRFFTLPDGWVGDFTGSDIAGRLPSFDQYVAEL